MMKKCKLTVLKTTLHEDLAKEYGVPNLGKCPLVQEGQVFYTDDYSKPEGLCEEAWKGIYQYVFALTHGVDEIYPGEWVDASKHKGVAIACCSDGFRPVIFKIERVEE